MDELMNIAGQTEPSSVSGLDDPEKAHPFRRSIKITPDRSALAA